MQKWLLYIALITLNRSLFAQPIPEVKERFPSYFGVHIKPVFGSSYLTTGIQTVAQNGYTVSTRQYPGYSFGGTLRKGITNLIAFETGLNYTQRNIQISMSIADSNLSAKDSLRFVTFDIPLNALVYIKLSEKFFANAAMGFALCYKPSNVQTICYPGGLNILTNVGRVKRLTSIELNANLGFEYRTTKSGFFYFGGSVRIPTTELYVLSSQHKYQGYTNTINTKISGAYMALDFRYFFPNIKNKGTQFNYGPIY